MKVAEFKANHILNNLPLSFDGRSVVHRDGKPVTGDELKPGQMYAVTFDEKNPASSAVLTSVQENRAWRRKQRRKGR